MLDTDEEYFLTVPLDSISKPFISLKCSYVYAYGYLGNVATFSNISCH